MNVAKVNNQTNFGSKILLAGTKKQVYTAFAKVNYSDEVFPYHRNGSWIYKTLTFRKGLFNWRMLISTGNDDVENLKKFCSTIKFPRSGLATKEQFNEYTENLTAVSAKKVLKAIADKKFDFINLKILE